MGCFSIVFENEKNRRGKPLKRHRRAVRHDESYIGDPSPHEKEKRFITEEEQEDKEIDTEMGG
jgi:hypothetical protein